MATGQGLAQVTAICKEARSNLDANLSHATSSNVPQDFGRELEAAARDSAVALDASISKIEALQIAKQQSAEVRATLHNLEEHRSLLIEFAREIHPERQSAWKNVPGWMSLYGERDLACGQHRAKTE